ncbi:hypothetical protein [Bacillus toyonensis]|uniref:Uncharacterized protein n=1 Tax=Bacillus toyonensis TaxID=155322 RepID=A0A2C4RDJ1_9BACI|nr:hypothetical protein [Bacillus toyonensis]PGB03275.1 hypothetical protein COL93_06910 [Bacillus toyonensis]PHD74638.1 hypothetical protein COF40_00825 [Bacillus toyonensis]
MLLLLKLIVTLLLVGIIFCFAVMWEKLDTLLTNTIFKNINKIWRTIVFVILTILLELFVIWRFSIFFQTNILESLVMGSLLLLCCVWLIPYFVTLQRNTANAYNHHFGSGVESEKVELFRIRMNPFIIGTIFLSTVSFCFGFFYYLPYFL